MVEGLPTRKCIRCSFSWLCARSKQEVAYVRFRRHSETLAQTGSA